MQKIAEGEATITIPDETLRKKSLTFYNPAVALQRDINIAFLRSIPAQQLRIADVLAGSGIRSIRFLLELPKQKRQSIVLNDANPQAVKRIQNNLAANKLDAPVFTQDASQFLHEQTGFTYIDIDPFGSPAPYLDAALQKIITPGWLSVTATDTAALSGSSVAACVRKYWSRPLKNEFMHEIGLRILIRKVQLVGAQYEKAVVPVYCHATRHYYRAYFKIEKSKSRVKDVLAGQRFVHYCFRCLRRFTAHHNNFEMCCDAPISIAGPLWGGLLWDSALAENIAAACEWYGQETVKLARIIAEESSIDSVGFYSPHHFAKKHGFGLAKQEEILSALRAEGFAASRTHLSGTGIRTDADSGSFLALLCRVVKKK